MKAVNGFKICSKCRIKKPINEYHKNKTQSDGFHNWCKECLVEFRNGYKTKKQEYDKQYNIEHADKKRQVASDWYYAHHDEALQHRKEWRETHKDEIREYFQSEHFKEISKKYKGRYPDTRENRKKLKWISFMDNPFPDEVEIDLHHINDLLVIPFPRTIHNICNHNTPKEHRERCNVWLYYLFGIDFEKLLSTND